jgi:cardiolipin synthase
MREPHASAATEKRRGRPLWPLVALAVLAILLAIAAVLWMRAGGDQGGASSGGVVRLATPPAPTAATTGIFIEPGDGRGPLLDEIAAARESIDLEVYIISDDIILQALEEAQARGVAVRVILEEHPFGGGGGQPAIFQRLEEAGIAVRWGNPAFRFSHIKMLVIDDEVAIILNQNITTSAFTSNREFGVITTEAEAVRTAAAIFEADWARGPEPDPEPLVVSPSNARQKLLELVEGAETSLDVYAEVLRDPELLDALIAAEARGVQVRVIISPSNEFQAERAALAAAGVEIRLLNALYVHAKMILADGERAYLGSQNLSATSLDLNRELGIIVDDPVSLARLSRTFALDFGASTPDAPEEAP